MEQKINKKKIVNFPSRVFLRVTEIEHRNLKKYAEKNKTTITKLLRAYIQEITQNV